MKGNGTKDFLQENIKNLDDSNIFRYFQNFYEMLQYAIFVFKTQYEVKLMIRYVSYQLSVKLKNINNECNIILLFSFLNIIIIKFKNVTNFCIYFFQK